MAAHAYARTGAVALTPRGRTRAAKSQDQPTGSAVRREPTSPLCRWEPTGSLCRRDPTNSSVGRDSTTAVRRPCDGREHARRDPRCRCGRSGTDRPGRSLRTDPLPPSGKYTSRVAPMSRCRCPTGRARSMRSADVGIMTRLSAGRRNCHGQRAPDARAGPWAGRPCGRAARLATGAFRLPAEPSAQLFHEEVRRPARRRGVNTVGTSLTPEFWRLFAVLLVLSTAITLVLSAALDVLVVRMRRRHRQDGRYGRPPAGSGDATPDPTDRVDRPVRTPARR